MFVATLIDRGGLGASEVDATQARLDDAGCAPTGRWRWLDEGEAADIPFATDPAAARAALSPPAHADIVVQPAAHRAKRLLVADMDSTMITVECIDELADYAGCKPQVAAVTDAAMRGELDFAQALGARVALLADLPTAAIAACLAERVQAMPGAATLIATLRARGVRCVLVSGGFTHFAEPVGQALGFDRVVANTLEVAGDRLTGRVLPPIVGADTKLAVLEEEAAALRLARHQTIAVGDGANDLRMIGAAGLGVAYRAKPVVAAAADAAIRHGDLTTILYALGIPRSQWIERDLAPFASAG